MTVEDVIQTHQAGFADTRDSSAIWVPDLRLVVADDAADATIFESASI